MKRKRKSASHSSVLSSKKEKNSASSRPVFRKFLGLELGGAKSQRTAAVVLKWYLEQQKIFVDLVEGHWKSFGDPDAELIEWINEQSVESIAVHAPLTLPPCVNCKIKPCPSVQKCTVPAVKWMRKATKKGPVLPYLQRPVDLLLRGEWQEEFPLPTDDTLGSGRAPLAARITYLQKHISTQLLEVNPRLALMGLAPLYRISQRELRRYRDVEFGQECRLHILERLSELQHPQLPQIFLYDAEVQVLAKELAAFDAFFNALMPIFGVLGFLEKLKLEPSWGTIAKLRSDLPTVYLSSDQNL